MKAMQSKQNEASNRTNNSVSKGFTSTQLRSWNPQSKKHHTLQNMMDNSPQVAQLKKQSTIMNAQHGVVQLVGAGSYRTSDEANLRNEAHEVIIKVPQGSEIEVERYARTSNFTTGLFFGKKDHTWISYKGYEGWLKDEVLGNAIIKRSTEIFSEKEEKKEIKPIFKKRSKIPTSSMPIGIGGRGGLKDVVATTTVRELDDYSQASNDRLEDPGIAKDAVPLGLGGLRRENPKDYGIYPQSGALYERTKANLLDIDKSPFVLDSSLQLFGGQGKNSLDIFSGIMESHAVAQAGSPVWAGELAATGGKVTSINNQSGTYMLSDKANINLIKYLYRNQVITQRDLDGLDVQHVYKPGLDRDGKLKEHHWLTKN